MSRHAKAGQNIETLRQKIEDAGGIYEVVYQSKIQDDLKKIEFDCENVTDPDDEEGFNMPGFQHGYDTLPNGIPVCWVGAGGDWEDPLAFCVYIGEDNSLRAYVPEDEYDGYHFEELKHFGLRYWFDMEKLRAAACKRIVVK